MINLKTRVGRSVFCALIAASATLTTTRSFAEPRYDGLWSVSVVTTKGDCIPSYRYPMLIANGVLGNGGALPINVSGKVAATGAVVVMVSSGTTSATGTGHLSGATGSGSWRGASCAGSWTAERHDS